MSIESFAEDFSSAGYACIMFDYRRWGASDGTPRNVLIVEDQLEDYRTVIQYARQQEDLDSERLVLWGSSFSGGHVTTLAAESNAKYAAVVAQLPYTGGLPEGSLRMKLGIAKAIPYAILDYIKRMMGARPLYIPVSGKPGELGVICPSGCLEGLESLALKPGDWDNSMGAAGLLEVAAYAPRKIAALVQVPIFVLVCGRDNLCPPARTQTIIANAPHAESIVFEEAGHFDIYSGKPYYTRAVEAELEFLKRRVPVVLL